MLQGKTEDEIYINEKQKMDMVGTQLPKVMGYIAPDEYEQRKNEQLRRSNSNLFLSESSMDSFSMLSQQSNTSLTAIHSQSSEYINQLSQSSCFAVGQRLNTSQTKTNMVNSSTNKIVLTNSSSKSNSKSSVLRENVDSDQRQKSAQKIGFSGKDQKNVSPYNNDKVRQNSLNKQHKVLMSSSNSIMTANILKAKRQISFDS